MNSPLLPAFPPELEQEIFEIAATDIPESMPQLIRVARRVSVWIEPLLFRTLILTVPYQLDPTALRHAIEKHPAKFAKYLQNFLDWENHYDKEWSLRTLSLYSGIRNLTLFYADSGMAPPSTPPRPLFQTLTHLNLWDSNRQFLTELPFAQFSALTHLSVNNLNPQFSPFLTSTLRNCARLCVLVNMWLIPFEPGNETHHSVDDPRFVLMWLSNDEYTEDWKVGVEGGNDFWIRAELFIAKRKRAEIQPASRYWIVDDDSID
ncbi:hypothetical protein C8J57DRAFT_1517822 [Mycena rebaudengoi]|nr:hypothetical protein C8J57DRAFT_1517822 [Mycena rebaudengoi]